MIERFVIRSKEDRARCMKALQAIRSTPLMEVIVKEYKEDKTAAQRKFWHFLIDIMAGELGYTRTEMKGVLKDEILGNRLVEFNGRARIIAASSEDERKKGYSSLIDHTYRIAAEQGIVLPEPNKELNGE